MKKFLHSLWQEKQSRYSLLAGGFSLLTIISFTIMYQITSYEATEMPELVLLSGVLACVAALVGSWRNWFHVLHLTAFVGAVCALFLMLSGRISYLAFYFSGDAMATGLSPMLVAAFVFALGAVVLDAMAIFSEPL